MSEQLPRIIALLSGALLILSALFYSRWWGPVASGVIIGIGAFTLVGLLTLPFLGKLWPQYQVTLMPIYTLAVTLLIAIVVRQLTRNSLVWPVHFQTPEFFHPKSFFLLLVTIFLALLLIAFGRSIGRGEGVAIESHWGGLGGGIGGFRLSTPLIYLLGIVTLLVVMAAIGWQAYGPTEGAEASASPTPSATPSPTPTTEASTPSPSPTASVTPNINRSPSPTP